MSNRLRIIKMSFPFFNLPILIQCKILRQYVSLVDKIHVLSVIPEFYNLLESKALWPKSKEKLEYLKWICLLKPGLYFDSELPKSRINVSFNEMNLTMSVCYFTYENNNGFEKKEASKIRSYSQVLHFLTQLKSRVISAENIITYYNKNMGFVTIDHNLNIMFRYNKIYKIINNECILEEKRNVFSEPNFEYHRELLFEPTYKFKVLNDKVVVQNVKFLIETYVFLPYQWKEELQKDKKDITNILITMREKNRVKINFNEGGANYGFIAWILLKYLNIEPSWVPCQ